MKGRLLTTLLATIVSSVVAIGCGAGGSSTTNVSTGADPSGKESSAEFISPGGENKPAEFGKEASSAEREAASAVLAANLKAREEGDFAAQCASLAKGGLAAVFEVSESLLPRNASATCASTLEALATPLANTEAVRKDTLQGQIAALRVKGERGFALYHGNDGNDYAMPMAKEGGTWRVAAIVTARVG